MIRLLHTREYLTIAMVCWWTTSCVSHYKPDIHPFDDLLLQSSYAQLLKEVINMADTVGLLSHRMNEDERRFIEDSVLGKIVRIARLLPQVQQDIASGDIAYVHYWLHLAKDAHISPLIADEIDVLAQNIRKHFAVIF